MTLEEFAKNTTEADVAKWCAENPDVVVGDNPELSKSCLVARMAQQQVGDPDIVVGPSAIRIFKEGFMTDWKYHKLSKLVRRFDYACPATPWTAAECAKTLGLAVEATPTPEITEES